MTQPVPAPHPASFRNSWTPVILRSAAAYGLVLAVFFGLSAQFAVFSQTRPYVGAAGIGTWQLLLPPILIAVILTFPKKSAQSVNYQSIHPTARQVVMAAFFFLLTVLLAHWVTHPPYARYQLMQQFIALFPWWGESFLAYMAFLASLLLPLVPALFLVFHIRFLRSVSVPLLLAAGIFLLFICTQIFETAYFRLTVPLLLTTLSRLLSLLSFTVTTVPARGFITVGGYQAQMGPACTEFAALALFAGLWIFVLLRLKPSFHISVLSMLLGLLSLSALNVLRIAAILVVGVYAPRTAVALFHGAVGGGLFLLFFWTYLTVFRRGLGGNRF